MAAPWVQIEDDNYLYSAYLIHRGQTPYLDFVQANPPLLEQLTAPWFALVGATYRVGEFLSAGAILATALALWSLGDRFFRRPAGLVAAVLYSWMPLTFRYHFYEREVFCLAASSLGLALIFSAVAPRRGAVALTGGALCGIAFHFKQVGVFPAIAVVSYLLGSRQFRVGLCVAMGALLTGAGILALDFALYGREVALQSFLLHLMKGSPLPLEERVLRLGKEVGPLVPAAVIGLLAVRRDPISLFLMLWAGLELLFMLQLSSTFWPHYMVTLLGPLALFAGAGTSNRSWRAGAAAAFVAGAVLLAWQARHTPLERLGFGGVGRVELASTAESIAEWVPPDSTALMCPPAVALQADRIKMFNYIDTLGFTRQLQAADREGKLREVLEHTSEESFSRTLARANGTWVPEALEAIRSRRVIVVVPEGELPIGPDFLTSNGYRAVKSGHWFDLYVRPELQSPP